MTAVFSVLALAALAYVSFMVWIYVRQTRRMYRPLREIRAVPAERGFDYEDIGFTAEDGTRLHGWYVPCPGARHVLLFLHGSTRNISWCLDSLAVFHRLGFSTFLFDYRGYGRSEGRPDEEGIYRDAEAAWDYLVRERTVEAGRIVVMGRSLGGAVACWLAARHPPRALVLESTFLSFPDLAAGLHPRLPARLLARYRYPVKDYIRQVRCPVLLMHSRDDELIPYQHASMLYGIANEPKRLVEIAGPHYDGYLRSGDRYVDGLARFFSEFL
ncbi:MAG: alpha/beta fold hydrolase [Gammaproteobacteria bacterium]|nr:alpha/beta fold hydrolase [Gammaproteobacteria bacterium]